MSDNDGEPKLRKRVGELIILAIFLIADAWGFWGQNHALCLTLGVAGIIGLLIYDAALPTMWVFVIGLVLVIGAGGLYALHGPPRVPQVEVIGSIQPGNEPTPPNACNGAPGGLSPSTLEVLIGSNVLAGQEPDAFNALQVGNCRALTMHKDVSGVGVNADLYDATGKHVATVINNQTHVLTDDKITVSREGDLSTLVVTDEAIGELLFIHYLNPTTIRVRGIFGCPGHSPVRIDDKTIAGSYFTNSCLRGHNAIVVQ